jgi:S1-C subfamily serine protease
MTRNELMLYSLISAIIVVISASASSYANTNRVMAQSIVTGPSPVTSIVGNNNNKTNITTASGIPAQQEHVLSVGPPLNAIFKKAENSVVQITSRPLIPRSIQPGTESQRPVTALGSGFISDNQGHVITNSHVVDAAQTADVTFVNGNRFTAKVLGNDVYSDIAVLKIVLNSSEQTKQQQQALLSIKPLPIGNSSAVQVGDQVIAIGNPFGLSDTMTTGIVSGISRVLPAAAGTGFSIPNAIQTDAPINPGNSGGPLLNTQGQVIGINTAILSGSSGFSGIGFAVPSNTITKVVPTLIQNGTYPHPFLGLTVATLTSDVAENVTGLEAAPSNLRGIYVDTITKSGPADKAGIHGTTTDQYSKKHVGDIITAIDGQPVTRSDDLITYIDQHKSVGDSVTFTVYRNGHTMDLKATLANRPTPPGLLAMGLPPVPAPPESPSPPPESPSPPPPSSPPSPGP